MKLERTNLSYIISTHTPHAGRDAVASPLFNDVAISTHTPHAGRDMLIGRLTEAEYISTHTPHAGRDMLATTTTYSASDFNSHAPCGA